jgi:hypothetical protein
MSKELNRFRQKKEPVDREIHRLYKTAIAT